MNEPRKRITQRIRLEPAQQSQLIDIQRRSFLRAGLTVGAMSMLTGCNLQDGDQVDKVLWAMSRWNDRVQAWLFNGQKLAPTYSKAQLTNPFPFNAFYPEYNVPELELADYRLAVSGLVRDKQPWTLEALRQIAATHRHHATDLYRRLECGRAVGRRAAEDVSRVHRRGYHRTFRRFQMRRPLLLEPGHAHRAASANPAGTGTLAKSLCHRTTATRCACGCRPSWASRTPSTSSRFSSATKTPAGIGRIRDITGSAGSRRGRRASRTACDAERRTIVETIPRARQLNSTPACRAGSRGLRPGC